MIIYVSSPYSAPTESERLDNVRDAIDAGIDLMKMGQSPIIPILTHYVDVRAVERKTPLAWEDYMRVDLDLIRAVDAVFVLRIGNSRGVKKEIDFAHEIGKQVFYTLDEIKDHLAKQKLDCPAKTAASSTK